METHSDATTDHRHDGDDDEDDTFRRLKEWVIEHGGCVHPDLRLVRESSASGSDSGSNDGAFAGKRKGDDRELVAARDLPKGDLLIRIPSVLALGYSSDMTTVASSPADNTGGGSSSSSSSSSSFNRDEPDASRIKGGFKILSSSADHNWKGSKTSPPSSPWLRCLIALYRAQNDSEQDPQSSSISSSSTSSSSAPPSFVALSSSSPMPTASLSCPPVVTSSLSSWKPYLDSLPVQYDTLMGWTNDEIAWLVGTGLHGILFGGRESVGREIGSTDSLLVADLRDRYLQRVRPRLVELGLIQDSGNNNHPPEEEFERFIWACQAISTRCFHVDDANETTVHSARGSRLEGVDGGGGPYFIPVVDLLNHCSDPQAKVTTLTVTTTLRADGKNGKGDSDSDSEGVKNHQSNEHHVWFEMRAERDVREGEPVTHSYGNRLTSSQCLQTFGFVPISAVLRAGAWRTKSKNDHDRASCGSQCLDDDDNDDTSPCVLTKDLVLECCRYIIQREIQTLAITRSVRKNQQAQANVPSCSEETIAGRKDDNNDDEFIMDETWELRFDPDRDYSSFPDHFLINPSEPLPDDLVTLLSLPFLPNDAYRELVASGSGDKNDPPKHAAAATGSANETAPVLLDRNILDDAFLGQLVGRTVLEVAQRKASEYPRIRLRGIDMDDRDLLNELLQLGGKDKSSSPLSAADASSKEPAIHGRKKRRLLASLTIRLEEKLCLDALRREAIRVLFEVSGVGDDLEDSVGAQANTKMPTILSLGDEKRAAQDYDSRELYEPRNKRPRGSEKQE